MAIIHATLILLIFLGLFLSMLVELGLNKRIVLTYRYLYSCRRQ